MADATLDAQKISAASGVDVSPDDVKLYHSNFDDSVNAKGNDNSDDGDAGVPVDYNQAAKDLSKFSKIKITPDDVKEYFKIENNKKINAANERAMSNVFGLRPEDFEEQPAAGEPNRPVRQPATPADITGADAGGMSMGKNNFAPQPSFLDNVFSKAKEYGKTAVDTASEAGGAVSNIVRNVLTKPEEHIPNLAKGIGEGLHNDVTTDFPNYYVGGKSIVNNISGGQPTGETADALRAERTANNERAWGNMSDPEAQQIGRGIGGNIGKFVPALAAAPFGGPVAVGAVLAGESYLGNSANALAMKNRVTGEYMSPETQAYYAGAHTLAAVFTNIVPAGILANAVKMGIPLGELGKFTVANGGSATAGSIIDNAIDHTFFKDYVDKTTVAGVIQGAADAAAVGVGTGVGVSGLAVGGRTAAGYAGLRPGVMSPWQYENLVNAAKNENMSRPVAGMPELSAPIAKLAPPDANNPSPEPPPSPLPQNPPLAPQPPTVKPSGELEQTLKSRVGETPSDKIVVSSGMLSDTANNFIAKFNAGLPDDQKITPVLPVTPQVSDRTKNAASVKTSPVASQPAENIPAVPEQSTGGSNVTVKDKQQTGIAQPLPAKQTAPEALPVPVQPASGQETKTAQEGGNIGVSEQKTGKPDTEENIGKNSGNNSFVPISGGSAGGGNANPAQGNESDAGQSAQTETEQTPEKTPLREERATSQGEGYINYRPGGKGAEKTVTFETKILPLDEVKASHDLKGNPEPDYPSALQPRDRTTFQSKMQVAKLAKNLDPERLTGLDTISSGAPIINKDGYVESGNGRTLAVKQAAVKHPAIYAQYVKHLQSIGYDTAGIKNPVLVRIRTDAPTARQSERFAEHANDILPEHQTASPNLTESDNVQPTGVFDENTGKQPIPKISGNDAGTLENVSAGEIPGIGTKRVSGKGTGTGGGKDNQGTGLPAGTRVEDAGGMVRDQRDVDASAGGEPTGLEGSNRVKEEDYSVLGGKKTKARQNIRAIETARELTASGRKAFPEEKAVLAKYTGWGGLKNAFAESDAEGNHVFPKGWDDVGGELAELFKDDERAFNAVKQSTVDAFYTSPLVTKQMWQAVSDMNFTGGRILEPSVGSGIFFGLMPENIMRNSDLTAVELDKTTAEIVRHLYPEADVKVGGFEDFPFTDGEFDLIIGNPPFGNTGMTDNVRKALKGMSIHNYFIAKSVDLLRPGGVVAFVVTSNFLDGNDERARRYIADKAVLLGAVRLPNNTFSDTSVTTDIVFFHKPLEGVNKKAHAPWLASSSILDAEEERLPLSPYFVQHPENMIGEWGMYGNMYGRKSAGLKPVGNRPLETELPKVLATFVKPIFTDAIRTKVFVDKITRETADTAKPNGFYKRDGVLYQKNPDGTSTELGKPDASVGKKSPGKKAEVQRQAGMTDLKDLLKNLIAAQMNESAPLDSVETLRDALNKQYDGFFEKFGAVNSRENRRAFAADPDANLVFALEKEVSKDKGKPVTAKKSDILTKRTYVLPDYATRADNATDALVASMTDKGKPDLAYMRNLYDKPEDEILRELEGIVFTAPDGALIPKDIYFSGNVRQKEADARGKAAELAEKHPQAAERFRKNADRLKAAFPETVESYDMNVKFGASWIPPKIMGDFLGHIWDVRVDASYTPITDSWKFTVNARDRVDYVLQSQWGTDKVSYADIAVALSKQIPPVVMTHTTGPNGEKLSFVNDEETANAREKYNLLMAAWNETWPDVYAKTLVPIYNEKFNAIVAGKYDGLHLKFYGKVPDSVIALNDHQKNGVYRIMNNRSTLLDHVVGAGKTFTAIAAVMEMKRTGMVQKPIIAVPNHLVGQWAKDCVTLYPDMNVLTAEADDFSDAAKRKAFLAKMATSNFDAVIIPHSTFSKLSVSPEYSKKFIEDELVEYRNALAAEYAQEGKKRNRRVIGQLENAVKKKEQKLKDLADQAGKDDIVYFDKIGFDHLTVDESQEFKNLEYATRLEGKGFGNKNGSKKAYDLLMKVRYLQTNPRSKIVFLTGTPLSNSISEAYTLQKYLQPDELRTAGMLHFDAWVRNFAEVTTGFEITVAGKYKINNRLSRFVNLPELQRFYGHLSDTVTIRDIQAQFKARGADFDIPKVRDGKPQNIIVPASDTVLEKMDEIALRAQNIPRKPVPGSDNMLSLATMARKLAIDPRVLDPKLPADEHSKLTAARDKIFERWKDTAEDKGTQLVFLDLSVPSSVAKGGKEKAKILKLLEDAESDNPATADKAQNDLDAIGQDEVEAILNAEKFSAYDWLKSELVRLGIPDAQIRFIHDFQDKAKKDVLFRAVNDGEVRVLMGSSQKMGAGTNVQQRLVSLHHLDAPWRPSDLEQREGRIIRRGNVLYKKYGKDFAVDIFRYATERTLDAFMWQILEFKSKAFEQFRQGDLAIREMTLKDGESMNAQEIKALASGNPKILQQIELQREVSELKTAERGFKKQQANLKGKIADLKETLRTLEERAPDMLADTKAVKALPEKTVLENMFNNAYDKNYDIVKDIRKAVGSIDTGGDDRVGFIGGFRIAVTKTNIVISRPGSVHNVQVPIQDGLEPGKEAGLTTRVINAVKRIPQETEETGKQIVSLKKSIPELEKQIVAEWPKREELRRIVNNLDAVEQELYREAVADKSVQQEIGKTPETVSNRMTPGSQTGGGSGGSPQKVSYRRTYVNATPMPNYVPTYIDTVYPPRPANGKLTVGNRTVTLPQIYDDDNKADEEPIRAADVRKMFEKIMGKRIFFSKLKKNVAGHYKPKTGEVGLQAHNDIETVAHEFAHWLEQHSVNGTTFSDFYKNTGFKQEIWDLSATDDKKTLQSEGFADFVRLWLSRVDDLKPVAPNAVPAWEHLIRQDKRFAEAMFKLQQTVHAYLNQGPEVLLESKQGEKSERFYQRWLRKAKYRPLERMKASVFEEYHGAKVVERELNALKPKGRIIGIGEESPFKQYINSRGAAGNYEQVIQHNTVVWDENVANAYGTAGDFIVTGEGLAPVLKPITVLGEKPFLKFQLYLAAMRAAHDLKPQGRERLLNDQEMAAGLDLANRYPMFEDVAREFYKFNTRMLKFYVSMGLITQGQMDAYQKYNPHHVPFFRVDETGLLSEVEGGGSIIGKRLYGGTQNLRNIAQNITEGLFGNIRAAFKARAKSKLFKLIGSTEDGAYFARKLRPDSHLITVSEEQKTAALAKFLCDTDPQTFGQFDPKNIPRQVTDYLQNNPDFLNSYQLVKPRTTGTLVEETIIDGQREYYEVKERFLVDLLTVKQMVNDDSLMQNIKSFLHFDKVLYTQAVTTIPAFGLANAIKDYPVSWIWSQYNHIPFVSVARGFRSVVKKDQTYRDFMLHGGGGSNIGGKTISLRGAYDILDVKSNNPLVIMGRLWIKYIVSLSEKSELINRIPEFEAILEKTGNKTEAAFRGRRIGPDFAATGSANWRKDAGAIIPFFGAALNGVNNMYEGLFEQDGRITPRSLFDADRARIYAKSVAFASVIASTIAVNMNDPKYQELDVYEKSSFIHLYRIGDHWIKIPVEGIPKMINSLVQSGYSGLVEKDGKFAGRLGLVALSELQPVHITGVPEIAINLMTNTAWYDAPIVPEDKARMAPEKQVKDRTTGFAKGTEKFFRTVTFGAFDPSPLQVDYVLKSMGGNWGTSLLGLADRLTWDTSKYGEQPFPFDVLGSLTYKREVSRVDNEHTRTSVKYYSFSHEVEQVVAGMSSDKGTAKPEAGEKIKAARKRVETVLKEDENNLRYKAVHSLLVKTQKLVKDMKDEISDITFDKGLTRPEKEKQMTAEYERITQIQKNALAEGGKILLGTQSYAAAARIIGVSEKGKHPLKLTVEGNSP